MGEKLGSWSTVIAFFIGMAIIAVIDKLIPQEENPHEIKKMENIEEKNIKKISLFKNRYIYSNGYSNSQFS